MESSKPHISLICVGSELLRGKINTHISTLARRLASVGLDMAEEHTIGDDLGALTRTIQQALQDSDLVIITGGLGPTFDDLTREATAEAVGHCLIYSEKLFKEIFRKFKKARLHKMPPANKRQAYLIEGAIPISNSVGTAPGQWLDLNPSSPAVAGRGSMDSPPVAAGNDEKKVLILLPGPPSELNPMLDHVVLPRLRKAFPTLPRAEAHLHFVGLPESVVDQRIRPIIEKEKGIHFTILAHLGLVDFDIFVSEKTKQQAQKRLSRLVRKICGKMGKSFYGMDNDYPLAKVVMQDFVANKATLAVAESCTGGMLAKRLTDAPGSSDYFLGGIVSYSNKVKVSSVGVSPATLRVHGAVSKEAATEMAKGVRERLGSTWGVGITGIAGPSGATAAKPIGLVYIGLSGPYSTKTLEFRFRGSRDAVRQRSVIAALDMLRQIYL